MSEAVTDVVSSDRTTLFLTNTHRSQQWPPDQTTKSLHILWRDRDKLGYEKKHLREHMQQRRYQMWGQPFQTKPSASKSCTSRRIALLNYENGRLKSVRFKGMYCNSWACPRCQMHKALTLKYKIRKLAEENNLRYFWTLTLDPKKIPTEYLSDKVNNTHKYITKLFNHFTTILRRKSFEYVDARWKKTRVLSLKTNEKKLKYIWVIEFQQNGNAHLHILVNYYLPVAVVRTVWTYVGGGHSMKVMPVHTITGVSSYIADYIVKGLKSTGVGGFKYFERRYAISLSCTKPKRKATPIYPELSGTEVAYALQDDGLGWVYNELFKEKTEAEYAVNDDLSKGEEITTPSTTII